TSLLELEANYSITPNEITSSNLEGTIAFDNNDIELDIRNEEILEDSDIIPGPTTNENNETTLEIVDRTQDQRAIITGIINDLTEEKVNPPF
ncbi:15492_t:CDS:1, partial [Gigaspora rosea]